MHNRSEKNTSRFDGGFSLIELMIALVLGLLLTEGVYVLFTTVGRANTAQIAYAKLQENGRIAIDMIAADLRLTGHMPCGSRATPNVFAKDLGDHIAGAPDIATKLASSNLDAPYNFIRSLFIVGSACNEKLCAPPVENSVGVPANGLLSMRRVPGADVLTVRYLQGEPNSTVGSLSCGNDGKVEKIFLKNVANAADPPGFDKSLLTLVASCSQSQILRVEMSRDEITPIREHLGSPDCSAIEPNMQIFDFDTAMQTVTYYLRVVGDDVSSNAGSALIRRVNGIDNEVAKGVERLNFRYSVADTDGKSYWLAADQVDAGVAVDGSKLFCGADRACGWTDVTAIDIHLLVNTVDNLKSNETSNFWAYGYSPDGDSLEMPQSPMRVTGLRAGQKLRREFHTVVALRNFST